MIGKGLWAEFKDFAFKGNMIDLAVAVVIGQAFGKIIAAMVKDIIMPLVGYALGFLRIPPDYVNWHLGAFQVGDLASEVIQFLIIAAAVFIVIVKLVGLIMKAAAAPPPPAAPAAPPPPTKEEVLLTEIRDLLKAQR